jgi:hypothetical protein
MTTEPTPTPTPETQNPPANSESAETRPDSADKTGFFNRVQRELKPHPTEEQEIVVGCSDEQT